MVQFWTNALAESSLTPRRAPPLLSHPPSTCPGRSSSMDRWRIRGVVGPATRHASPWSILRRWRRLVPIRQFFLSVQKERATRTYPVLVVVPRGAQARGPGCHQRRRRHEALVRGTTAHRAQGMETASRDGIRPSCSVRHRTSGSGTMSGRDCQTSLDWPVTARNVQPVRCCHRSVFPASGRQPATMPSTCEGATPVGGRIGANPHGSVLGAGTRKGRHP